MLWAGGVLELLYLSLEPAVRQSPAGGNVSTEAKNPSTGNGRVDITHDVENYRKHELALVCIVTCSLGLCALNPIICSNAAYSHSIT
jgi:hypothetical protein